MSDSYPSLFGVEAPQFQFESDDPVLLDYWRPVRDEADKIQILHESIKTRFREWDDIGKHWTFSGQILLFKYDTLAERQTKYAELLTYKRKLVTLWRRRDGEPIKNSAGSIVKFRFNKLGLKYFPFPEYQDVLELEFISQDVLDIKQSLIAESL